MKVFRYAFFALFLVSSAYSEGVTMRNLIHDMVDMHRFTDFPDPYYETVQFSSYDHRSDLPGGPDWFANSDGFGRESIPNFEKVLQEPGDDGVGEYLICDVQGPGAIVRVWTAAIRGEIKLFLDNQSEPVFEGSAEDFLRFPYKPFLEDAGIRESWMEGAFAQRNACYFPIPFASRCRITWTGKVNEIHFYQIQIRKYEPGTVVLPWHIDELKVNRGVIERVSRILKNIDEEWEYQSEQEAVPVVGSVAPGEKKEIAFFEGQQALERLTLKVHAQDVDRALRQTILHIRFDDHPWGQVQSPIGDFFGVAPGINPYDSMPFSVEPDGTMTCRYVMPFKKNARIIVENKGDQLVSVSGSALPMDYEWNPKTSMHFRARWRIDHDLTASGSAVQDLPFLLAFGKGVHVGTVSYLLNLNNVPTPGGNWWGEGDEKIFVDDDFRPSTFGTGSEDYYNYAWSSPDIFIFPYCGQPRNDGPANRGFVTNYRWHILDPLPFKESFRFYMELFSHETNPDVSYARMIYHYGRPGIMDDHLPITGEDVRHLELPVNWEPESRGQAQNAVFYQAEALYNPSDSRTVYVSDNLWSQGEHFGWLPENRGEEITFNIPIPEDGKYGVHFAFARTPHAGKVSIKMNNKSFGIGNDDGVVDLYQPHRTLLRNSMSDTLKLEKGMHEVTLRFEGSKASQPHIIGIDFIWIQKR